MRRKLGVGIRDDVTLGAATARIEDRANIRMRREFVVEIDFVCAYVIVIQHKPESTSSQFLFFYFLFFVKGYVIKYRSSESTFVKKYLSKNSLPAE